MGCVEGRSFAGFYECKYCDGFGKIKLDDFTLAYVECALWSSNDESDETGGEPLDSNYGLDDIAPATLSMMRADCAKFQEACGDHFISDNHKSRFDCDIDEQAGHDFWLTRNGHGAGFWDGDWVEPAASILDKSSKTFGCFNLYVGDDGQVWGY